MWYRASDDGPGRRGQAPARGAYPGRETLPGTRAPATKRVRPPIPPQHAGFPVPNIPKWRRWGAPTTLHPWSPLRQRSIACSVVSTDSTSGRAPGPTCRSSLPPHLRCLHTICAPHNLPTGPSSRPHAVPHVTNTERHGTGGEPLPTRPNSWRNGLAAGGAVLDYCLHEVTGTAKATPGEGVYPPQAVAERNECHESARGTRSRQSARYVRAPKGVRLS